MPAMFTTCSSHCHCGSLLPASGMSRFDNLAVIFSQRLQKQQCIIPVDVEFTVILQQADAVLLAVTTMEPAKCPGLEEGRKAGPDAVAQV